MATKTHFELKRHGKSIVASLGPTRDYPGLDFDEVQVEVESNYSTARFVMSSDEARILRDWLTMVLK